MTRSVAAVGVIYIQLFLALVTTLTLCDGRLHRLTKMIRTDMDVTGNYNCGLRQATKVEVRVDIEMRYGRVTSRLGRIAEEPGLQATFKSVR